MKKILSKLLFFLMGASFMGIILFITQCSNDDDDWLSQGINPNQLTDLTDYESINQAGEAIEEALLASDQTAIDSLVFKESLDFYNDNQEPYTPVELTEIGKAFKNRKMTTVTERFVEYTYTIDGRDFTMTMACEKMGVWKITRY